MNKLFTKIATFAIGAFMAVGVGVAATLDGSEPIEAHAETGYTQVTLGSDSVGKPIVIVATHNSTKYALTKNNGTSAAPTAKTINSIEEADENCVFYLGGDSTGWIFYADEAKTSWLYCTNTNNGVRVGTNTANTFKLDSSGYLKHNGTSRYLGVYTTNPDWRCYTNTTGNTANQTFAFYQDLSGGEGETPTTPVLSGISLSEQQTEFTVGDDFVRCTVTANYSDGSTANVTNDATFSGYDMSTAGEQTVTVAYEGKTTTYTINVKEPLPEGSLTHTINIEEYGVANGWVSGTKYNTITSTPFTVTATGKSNTGKYYVDDDGDDNWRIYQNETPSLTILADVGYSIASVKVSYEIDNTGILTHEGIHVDSDTTVTVNANSVTFSVGNTGDATNGQVRITGIYIIYIEVEVEITPFTSISITDENLELNLGDQHTLVWETEGGSNDTVLWESSAEGVATVSSGVLTAVDVGEATITAKSKADSSIYDTVVVEVLPASPTKMTISDQQKEFIIGLTIGYHFTETQNVISIEYSDDTTVKPSISDERLTLTIEEQEVTSETIVTSELLQGKTIDVTFTDDNGLSITHGSGLTNIQTIEGISITGETRNFTNGTDYLLAEDADSSITISYTSHFGQLDLDGEIDVDSTNNSIFDAEIDTTSHVFEGTQGTITINLYAFVEGQASIYVYINKNNVEIEYYSNPILVRSSAPSGGEASGDKFVKVTNTNDMTGDEYLIIYETGGIAFDGSLTTLDAVSNTVNVTITDSTIAATDAVKAATFTIDTSKNTVQSASGYYIGQTKNDNGMKSSTTTSYTNTISFNADGTVNFVSGGAYLRYNATSGQTRFRYYKSSSYTNQKAIALYMLVEGTSSLTSDFDYANEFVQTYMHPEIKIGVEGTGLCASDGWYTAAKAAFFNGDGEFHLDADQRKIVAKSFTDYFVRLQNWAIANGEKIEPDGDDYTVSNLRSPLMRITNNFNSSIIIIISISSILAMTTLVVIRKRRSSSK